MRVKSLCLLLLGSLSACTVGPDYQPIQTQVPEHWQAEPQLNSDLKPASSESLKNWWQGFGDATLNQLMKQALTGNKDLKIALTRIEQARAERRGTRAELFPAVNAKLGAQRQNNPMPGIAPGLRYNLFEIGFDALWEIDLFGRQQRRLEAASADLDAAAEQYGQALVLLTAELARSYIEYRNFQNLLTINQSNLETMRKTLTLTDRRFQEGLGTRHDLVRAKAQVEITEAQIPTLQASKNASLRQLELLIGQQPGALTKTLAQPAAIPLLAGQNILTSPAETIRNRPDIHIAERRLAAATAMQGAAIAELFPKISLSAFLGLRNTDIETLFKSAAFSYGTVANFIQPLLNFGRIQAGIDLAEARQQEAYLAYEKSVLEALRETETALSHYLQAEIRRQTLARAVTEQRESLRLSQLRYQEGVSSFLEVLDAQRALSAVESELANAQAATAIYLIAVYKSLGGGANGLPAAALSGEKPS